MHLAIYHLCSQRTGRDRVGVAPPIEQEIFVLHIIEFFGVEGHADKVEVGIETVNLEGILDVVARRAIAIVVGIVRNLSARSCWRTAAESTGCRASYCVAGWQRIAAKNVLRGIALRAVIQLLVLQGGIEAAAARHSVLSRTHVQLPDHAHLQVLGRSNVAMPEI